MAGYKGGGSKFTPETRERLLDCIARGLTITAACQVCSVSHDSFARWRKTDATFAEGIKNAEGRSMERWVGFIDAAAPKQWQAAAWLLERRYPHEYGRHLLAEGAKVQYDEAMLRALATEKGLDPEAFVKAVARAQRAVSDQRAGTGTQPGAPTPLPVRWGLA